MPPVEAILLVALVLVAPSADHHHLPPLVQPQPSQHCSLSLRLGLVRQHWPGHCQWHHRDAKGAQLGLNCAAHLVRVDIKYLVLVRGSKHTSSIRHHIM
jgi:hypothetical protein